VKVESHGRSERLFFGGGRSIILLEGSQASPVRPSDKGSVEAKTL
jgi:uncharacterized protein (DUF39 family)